MIKLELLKDSQLQMMQMWQNWWIFWGPVCNFEFDVAGVLRFSNGRDFFFTNAAGGYFTKKVATIAGRD